MRRRWWIVLAAVLVVATAGGALVAWLGGPSSGPTRPSSSSSVEELQNAINATFAADSWTLDQTVFNVYGPSDSPGGGWVGGPVHVHNLIVYESPNRLSTVQERLGEDGGSVICFFRQPCQKVQAIDIGGESWISGLPFDSRGSIGPFVKQLSGQFAVRFNLETTSLAYVQNRRPQFFVGRFAQRNNIFTVVITAPEELEISATSGFQHVNVTTTETLQMDAGRIDVVHFKQVSASGLVIDSEDDSFSSFGTAPLVEAPTS